MFNKIFFAAILFSCGLHASLDGREYAGLDIRPFVRKVFQNLPKTDYDAALNTYGNMATIEETMYVHQDKEVREGDLLVDHGRSFKPMPIVPHTF